MSDPDNGAAFDNLAFLLQHVAELRNITATQAITVGVSALSVAWPVYAATNPHNWTATAITFGGTALAALVHLLESPPRANPLATANQPLTVPSGGPIRTPDK
jgi:hypothetical protein